MRGGEGSKHARRWIDLVGEGTADADPRSGRSLRFVGSLMFNALMDVAALGTGLAISNSAADALDKGATGVRAIVRRIRLAGYVDIEWLNLADGSVLTATQVADLALCLRSDQVRPLLSMTAFALATRSTDLQRSLRENFISEAERWQISHKAGWHDKAGEVWNRIEEVYTGIVGSVMANEEVADELRIYTAFLATPLAEALADEDRPSDFASRLASLAANVERMSVVSKSTAKTIEQIRVSLLAQPISTLSQSEKFADFQELYVDRNFVDSDASTSVSSEALTLAGQPFRLVLMGSPGAGKSTFVKHLVRSSSDERRDLQIPALELRCREYVRNGWSKSVADHLLHALTVDLALDVDAQALDDLLLLGRAIVVFDGLDEVTNQTQRAQMVQRIHAFAGRYPAVSLLVTSREVGYERAPVSRALFNHLRLEEFSEEQIENYTSRWFNLMERTDLRDDFMSDSESIADIRRNPLLLSLLCMLYRERGAIPLNRRAVYSQCADELFHRWDTHRQIQQLESMPKYGDRLMQEIARWFYTTPSTGGGLDEQILTKVISNFMKDTLGFDSADAERDARDFLDFCASRLWLLAKVGTGHGGVRVFNFTHRTFYEYFAADSLARAGNDDDIANKIVESFKNDATSVLPELLIQAYDEYRERGAAKVYDVLCTRRPQAALLLRLMEGVNLPAYARKAAFDLLLRAYASGELSTDACRALFALTSSARKHYVEQYVMPVDQPIGRMLLLDAWASFQLSGRWTGRAANDWVTIVDEVVDQYVEAERAEWASAAIANWLLIKGHLAGADVFIWQYLVCESLSGWVPGVAWWALDAVFASNQSLPDDSQLDSICRRLINELEAGLLLPSVVARLDQALSELAIDQLPWDLRIGEDGDFVDLARTLLVSLALAAAEAGSSHLAVAIRNSDALALDELLLERLRRSRGYMGSLSARAAEVLTVLSPACHEWAMHQRNFCREE